MVRQKDRIKVKVPVMTSFIENLFEDAQQGFVGYLDLFITLWVVWGGPMMLDIKFRIKVTHILVLKRGTIISNDG